MNKSSLNDFFQNLGLTEKESLIYITLLELGPQVASVVAKKTRIARSSTFSHLDHLIKKGFAKREIKTNVQYFCAISPNDLKDLLKRSQNRAESQVRALEGLLPDLNSLCSTFSAESKVTYFEGIEGVCKMIDLVTQSDEPIYFISAHRFHPEIEKHIRESYVPQRQGMKNKNQMIVVDFEGSRDYVKFAEGVYDWVGFVNEEEAGFESSIAIYGDSIQFLSTHPEDLTGVLIKNGYLAKTMQGVFRLIKNRIKNE